VHRIRALDRWTVLASVSVSIDCGKAIGLDDFKENGSKAPEMTPDADASDAGALAVFAWQTGSCQSCAARACPSELAACADSESCRRFDACYGAHPTPAQRLHCDATLPDGAPVFLSFGRCIDLNCVDDCGGGKSWDCLGEPFEAVSPLGESFILTTEFYDMLSGAPVAGLTITACSRVGWTDLGCTSSKGAEGTTNEEGRATLPLAFPVLGVRQPWDGYFTVAGPGMYPELRYANIPFASDALLRYTTLTLDEYALITTGYDIPEAPGHGSLTADLFDCADLPARGVSIEIAPRAAETRRFYSAGPLDLHESATETGKDGLAIFGNVPEGLVMLRAVVAATSALIAEVEVPVRAGARTVVAIEPRKGP
jgi:hypothetical protein